VQPVISILVKHSLVDLNCFVVEASQQQRARTMQAFRRAAAARLTTPWDTSSCDAVINQLQQQASYAKRAGEAVDAKLQKVLKMMQPREIEEVQMSEEDYQEGMRRCAQQLDRRRIAAAAASLRVVLVLPGARKCTCLTHGDLLGCYCRHKEYSRMKMKEHRAWQADLTTKLKLKQAAVAALPPHLRAAAEVPDDEPFPLNRNMWTLTPPIEGFGKETGVTQQAGQKKFGTKHR
jgi:seryl-tRNA synthetase